MNGNAAGRAALAVGLAVRNMMRRGVPERVAMQLVGHRARSVFDRYHITTAHIRAYVAHRQAATLVVTKAYTVRRTDGTEYTVKERTRPVTRMPVAEVNRELAILKRMFSLALQAGTLLHRPHIPMLQERNTRTGFFEADQVASVLRHLPHEVRPVIEFGYLTAGASPRPIVRFDKAWKAACRAAGCPGRIPHDLRRTAVRNLVRAGIQERVCMTLTGHKTRSVFERYNIVSEGDLREAARRLDAVSCPSDKRLGHLTLGGGSISETLTRMASSQFCTIRHSIAWRGVSHSLSEFPPAEPWSL
jgi:hypothetical protein